MRLIVMGQQAFGQEVLKQLLEAGTDEVVAVYCAPDKEGRPLDPLKSFALEKGLPVLQPTDFKAADTMAEMEGLQADLLVMAYVTLFVPETTCAIPRLGAICFHPSLLPLHRGPSSINWPIIWGSTETGYSWFYPTDGLDEGDILLQRPVDIGPDDTLGDIYFKKIFPVATQSVLEVCDLFRDGNPPRQPQDNAKATYESWCRKKDAQVDWSQPASKVYNLIRGCNPQPGAWTKSAGGEVQIYDSALCPGDGTPGQITALTEDGVEVQADGGRILIKRTRPQGGGKVPASQWAAEAGLSVGDHLG
ncbi:MAG: methionyl-tRNA formyltransferase [Pseudomonadota bacterium]